MATWSHKIASQQKLELKGFIPGFSHQQCPRRAFLHQNLMPKLQLSSFLHCPPWWNQFLSASLLTTLLLLHIWFQWTRNHCSLLCSGYQFLWWKTPWRFLSSMKMPAMQVQTTKYSLCDSYTNNFTQNIENREETKKDYQFSYVLTKTASLSIIHKPNVTSCFSLKAIIPTYQRLLNDN